VNKAIQDASVLVNNAQAKASTMSQQAEARSEAIIAKFYQQGQVLSNL
jgi:hypothetical protein